MHSKDVQCNTEEFIFVADPFLPLISISCCRMYGGRERGFHCILYTTEIVFICVILIALAIVAATFQEFRFASFAQEHKKPF